MTVDDEGEDNDSGVLEPDESLDYEGVDDVLDEGYSPVERPYAVDDYGVTAYEESTEERLDARLARELPETARTDDGDGIGDASDTDGEPIDDEVGDTRAGRLLDADDGGTFDDDPDLYATDVGIDGAAASAEEAAVHVVPDADRDEV